jgi:hypothetical protein
MLCNRRGVEGSSKNKKTKLVIDKRILGMKRNRETCIKKENALWRKEIKRNVYMRLMQQGSRNTYQ